MNVENESGYELICLWIVILIVNYINNLLWEAFPQNIIEYPSFMCFFLSCIFMISFLSG